VVVNGSGATVQGPLLVLLTVLGKNGQAPRAPRVEVVPVDQLAAGQGTVWLVANSSLAGQRGYVLEHILAGDSARQNVVTFLEEIGSAVVIMDGVRNRGKVRPLPLS